MDTSSAEAPVAEEPEAARPARLHGRRVGRPLRTRQRQLMASALPLLEIGWPTGTLDPRTLFPQSRAIWLEIGYGGGEHLAVQAATHPEVGVIGCEVFHNGIASLLAEIEDHALGNVRLFTEDARGLLQALTDGSIERAFVLFPDPWPKLRHHKRRIISRATLDQLARVMQPGAELRIATDDRDYLVAILELATNHPELQWQAREPEDWRHRPADWPQTRYEQKAIVAGRPPAFLRFVRR